MRRTLIEQLVKTNHKKRCFLTADVGYGLLEPLRERMESKFINVGICEPTMISVAAGLALSGMEVFTYTMCSFYIKCIEQIKLDLCYQNLPVCMIGVGTGFDYEQHGTTHFALEDEKIMKSLLNIDVVTPRTRDGVIKVIKSITPFKLKRPLYLRIGRFDVCKEFDHKLKKYPCEGGSFSYFKKKYENKK